MAKVTITSENNETFVPQLEYKDGIAIQRDVRIIEIFRLFNLFPVCKNNNMAYQQIKKCFSIVEDAAWKHNAYIVEPVGEEERKQYKRDTTVMTVFPVTKKSLEYDDLYWACHQKYVLVISSQGAVAVYVTTMTFIHTFDLSKYCSVEPTFFKLDSRMKDVFGRIQ